MTSDLPVGLPKVRIVGAKEILPTFPPSVKEEDLAAFVRAVIAQDREHARTRKLLRDEIATLRADLSKGAPLDDALRWIVDRLNEPAQSAAPAASSVRQEAPWPVRRLQNLLAEPVTSPRWTDNVCEAIDALRHHFGEPATPPASPAAPAPIPGEAPESLDDGWFPSRCVICWKPITQYDTYGVSNPPGRRWHWDCVRAEAAHVGMPAAPAPSGDPMLDAMDDRDEARAECARLREALQRHASLSTTKGDT